MKARSWVPTRHCRIAVMPVNDGGTVAGRPRGRSAAGPVAQWLEPAAHNGLVAGSSPAGPTTLMIRRRSRTSVVIRRSDLFPYFTVIFCCPNVRRHSRVVRYIPSFCWHICWYLNDDGSEIPTCR
jgi:hypothetical protein